MAASAEIRVWSGPSRRRVPRFGVRAPLNVTVLRSGIPDTVPGRSVNLCERGIAAVLAGDLVPGEAVGIELELPLAPDALRARAMVRYQDTLRCGLEFIGMSTEQRASIREWVKDSKAEAVDSGVVSAAAIVDNRNELSSEGNDLKHDDLKAIDHAADSRHGSGGGSGGRGPKKRRWIAWVVALVLVAGVVGAWWWKWNRGWDEIESGLKNETAAAKEIPQAQVPAEVMEKLLVHRVEPVYPPEARQARLEGIIALDVIVGRDGTVLSMKPLNGPDVLARAAMDALRWWKFEPYRVNGEPAVVETTVAVEFKR
jgi:TonB family protein